MAKLLAWFSTRNGKYFTRSCVGMAGFAAGGLQMASNTFLLDKVKELCQVYKFGEKEPLTSHMKHIIKEVLEDSKLKDEEKRKIDFFYSIGEDTFHSGGITSPWGAIIGIPFTFDDPKKINFARLQFPGHENIDWVIDGRELIEALTISDKAKKFCLMREIHSCDIWSKFDNALVACFCVIVPADIVRRVNIKRDAFNLPIRQRLWVYGVFVAFSVLLYRCFKDPLQHIDEIRADKMAAVTGPEYLDGGIEFYGKVLERNKELRKLLGVKGEKLFMESGDENYWIITPRLPIRKRLELLQKMKNDQLNDS